MNIHYLQHVSYEGLEHIRTWADRHKCRIGSTRLFENEPMPDLYDTDWLIVMGGPMGVHDEDRFPWLIEEKRLIEKAIRDNKTVLGICLGAQLIADVLGAGVRKNKYPEIGWYPVRATEAAERSYVFKAMAKEFLAFHWHGDTFDIPDGAIRMAESDGCPNQAFEYNKKVIGLQFHLESTRGSIDELIKNNSDDLVEGKYIQDPQVMTRAVNEIKIINQMLGAMLDYLMKIR
ncbi:MAG: type 1 glutamine amidotransferase [Nitrospirota bacterium]|nr:MAG: type 1 glutamine amidotransferase [Nitrospirota bacterium]